MSGVQGLARPSNDLTCGGSWGGDGRLGRKDRHRHVDDRLKLPFVEHEAHLPGRPSLVPILGGALPPLRPGGDDGPAIRTSLAHGTPKILRSFSALSFGKLSRSLFCCSSGIDVNSSTSSLRSASASPGGAGSLAACASPLGSAEPMTAPAPGKILSTTTGMYLAR